MRCRREAVIPGGIRETLDVALPMVISLSFDTVMTFVDRLYLSSLGASYMSASMSGGLASFTVSTFFVGLIGYTNAMVAQNMGAGRENLCGRVLIQALLLAAMAWPVLLGVFPLVMRGLNASGIDPRQASLQGEYFRILMIGSVIPLVRHAFSSFFSGIGQTRVVMRASLWGLLINCGMNYLLIFGHAGVPAMGIRGAALGTLLGGMATIVVLVLESLKPQVYERFGLGKDSWRYHRGFFLELLRKGTPSGAEMFLNLLAFQMMVFLFHRQGPDVAVAATIMFTWDMVSFVPLLGIEVGVTSLVGRYTGARNLRVARRAIQSGLRIGWVFSALVFLAFVGVPDWLVAVFKPDGIDWVYENAAPLAIFMVRLAAIYVTIEAAMVVYAGALRGVGDTFWLMKAMVVIHWVLVLVLYCVLERWLWGARWGWGILVVLFMVFPLVLWMRWRSGKWKKSIMRA